MADKNPDDIDAIACKIGEAEISDEISRDSGSKSNNPEKLLMNERRIEDSDDDDENDDEYDMQGDKCGKCIIINQNFDKDVKTRDGKRWLTSRKGTKVDVARLQKMYRWLKFEVTVEEDVETKDDLETLLKKEASDENNNSSKCLVVCILSHGEGDGIYTADGDFYNMQDILNLFDGENCKSLIGRPKFFFIQACQENKDGKYVQFDKAGATESEDQLPKKAKNYLAANVDQFLFFSSTPGNVSWKPSKEGSWFIQTVCSVFERRAHKKDNNFYTMLLKINNDLADPTVKTMMSTTQQNTLRKTVRFHPDKRFKDFEKTRIIQATS